MGDQKGRLPRDDILKVKSINFEIPKRSIVTGKVISILNQVFINNVIYTFLTILRRIDIRLPIFLIQ